jgi:hypothetical protein
MPVEVKPPISELKGRFWGCFPKPSGVFAKSNGVFGPFCEA